MFLRSRCIPVCLVPDIFLIIEVSHCITLLVCKKHLLKCAHMSLLAALCLALQVSLIDGKRGQNISILMGGKIKVRRDKRVTSFFGALLSAFRFPVSFLEW